MFLQFSLQIIRNNIDIHSQLCHMKIMIHCLCNNINTAKVDAAHERGAKTAKEVQAFNGCAFNCGACKSSIQSRLALLKAESSPDVLAAE
jgi:bacterioferritin-associated ferredoxin